MSRKPYRSGRRLTAVGMAFFALAGAGGARAQGLWDDPAFALYRQAVEAIDGKDYDAARRLAAEAIARYPDHLLAHYLLAQAAAAQGAWQDAVPALEKVVALYPGSFAAHRDLGIALQRLGRKTEAARAWEAALNLRPDHEDVRVRLAFVLLETGERERAREHLEALAGRNTAVPEVWSALGRLAYEASDFPAAARAFTRAVELRDDGRAWFNLAVVRFRLNDHEGALQAFEAAARHPDVREQAAGEAAKLREVMEALREQPAAAPADRK